MSDQAIANDEVLYRCIPPGTPWLEPPGRITSANFKLRRSKNGRREEGLSVYRAAIVAEADVLARPEAESGSSVRQATAGEIRDLKNAEGTPLNLDVVAVGDENDPGHAEVRGPVPGKLTNSASRALKKLFGSADSFPEER